MIGQLHSIVIDDPDAHALATCCAALLGMEVRGAPGDDRRRDPVGHPFCLVWDAPLPPPAPRETR